MAVVEAVRAESSTRAKMLIGGQWCDSADGRRIPGENPARREKIAVVPRGGAADVDRAVEAVAAAFPAWASRSRGPTRKTRSAWRTTRITASPPMSGRTTSAARCAPRTAHRGEAGWVQVNQGLGQSPGHSYGGYKESGIGREFSLEGMLDSFTQKKNVTVNLMV